MIKQFLDEESVYQKKVINLIASENYPSDAVKRALASDFTNKYAEGYPGQRYYGGNRVVDRMEEEVGRLAKKVFSTDYHVNVQPYSGSIANLAVYFALLPLGATFLGLDLAHGGHLTHGHPVTISGKFWRRIPYSVEKESERIDYNELKKLAKEHQPKLIVSGASAYSRKIDFALISRLAHEVGALHLADISHISGLVATGLHPTPFGRGDEGADIVMTTTHKLLRGPRAALLFCKPELAGKIDRAVFPGVQGGPHLNNIAAIGVALEEALLPEYKQYCQQVLDNARTLSSSLSERGYRVVSGGTDNHLFLLDLRPQNISGAEAQFKLEEADIIVNKNALPFDTSSPLNPSGIRLGTPAVTTRGMKPAEMKKLAEKIDRVLKK